MRFKVFLYTEPGMVPCALSNQQQQQIPQKPEHGILPYKLTGYYYHLFNK